MIYKVVTHQLIGSLFHYYGSQITHKWFLIPYRWTLFSEEAAPLHSIVRVFFFFLYSWSYLYLALGCRYWSALKEMCYKGLFKYVATVRCFPIQSVNENFSHYSIATVLKILALVCMRAKGRDTVITVIDTTTTTHTHQWLFYSFLSMSPRD